MKARWIGAGSAAVPSPSSVVTFLSVRSETGVTQEKTGSPSTRTAGAALAEPAAELRGVKFQFVTQHVKQRRARIDV